MQFIRIRGARQHNLKDLDLDIPRGKIVVLTGLSGSGKSTLAFDTLYAEGQRRYVESLSVYARQFLERLQKPRFEWIEGLSPAIAIDQKAAGHNLRSTVGTMTEIYDLLRLLYARIGEARCPVCDRPVDSTSVDEIADRLLRYDEGTRLIILAPLARSPQGDDAALLHRLKREGYARIRINGHIRDIDAVDFPPGLEGHPVEAVVDRLVLKPGIRNRLVDSLETALTLSGGTVLVDLPEEMSASRPPLFFSENAVCPVCGRRMPELSPACFSFNSPQGACPECAGSGFTARFEPDLLIRDPLLSLAQGAVTIWANRRSQRFLAFLKRFAHQYGADIHTPFADLPEEFKAALFFGIAAAGSESLNGGTRAIAFKGLVPQLEQRFQKAESKQSGGELRRFMTSKTCPACRGARLNPEALAVKIDTRAIHEFTAMPVRQALACLKRLPIQGRRALIAERLIREIELRLQFLLDVGLDYVSLDRSTRSLSGGELQRIRLATQIGARLTGVLYVLDEPSIGLHPKEHRMLLNILRRMRDMGNTVLVVEHDLQTIRSADHVIELGPGAGANGGHIVFSGPPEALFESDSLTGQYIGGRLKIKAPQRRRTGSGASIRITGAARHNLKNIRVDFRLGCITCVTGVSGSGKSTLAVDVLYRSLAGHFSGSPPREGDYAAISGLEHVAAAIHIDQSPIGRTPRSNPAIYTGAFAFIRELYSRTRDARVRGYRAGRFSFNARGGRCEACGGEGVVKVEMQFLPDLYVPCEVCRGKRYNRETLEVRFKGYTIADILEMTVDQALGLFSHFAAIRDRLQTLADVGLGYVQLGQAGTTLSGGEAQRVKLARELSRRDTGRTVYILDEPTIGLHLHDIHRLLVVLNRLVDAGNTVVMIEHNLEVIQAADQVIDLGPGGGDRGGYVIAAGTPEQIAAEARSDTGKFLAELLARA